MGGPLSLARGRFMLHYPEWTFSGHSRLRAAHFLNEHTPFLSHALRARTFSSHFQVRPFSPRADLFHLLLYIPFAARARADIFPQGGGRLTPRSSPYAPANDARISMVCVLENSHSKA